MSDDLPPLKDAVCEVEDCPNFNKICSLYVPDDTPIICGCCGHEISNVSLHAS